MNPVVLFLIGVILGIVAISLWRIWRGRSEKPDPFFAACEYWIYQRDEKMPSQDQVMSLMVSRSPYAQGGHSPIGPREGLVFSDIRLSCTLVLRSKNPHVFRPDLFDDVEIDGDLLSALAGAQSIIKVRYLSEDKLHDDRHLQFMPHLADAYARCGDACAIYDVVSERLYTLSDFQALLGQDQDATRPEMHVLTKWVRNEGAQRAETRGMIKKGLPEFVSADAMPDNERLVSDVVNDAAAMAFRRGELLSAEIVEYFGDRFEVRLLPPKNRRCVVHIVRYQAI